jgi:sugar phosphate isomerase/epimerase
MKIITMETINRRSFIINSSFTMAGIVFINSAFAKSKDSPHFSFSTLGCPEWSLPEIVNCAADNEYDGIEIRGISGELDITKSPDFSSVAKIASTRKLIEDKNLKIICLDSSAQLHHADKEKRKNSLDEAKKYIDLAQQLKCPYIRVFPDIIPKGQEFDVTIDLITHGLIDLAGYAKGSKVKVLLESHGDFVGVDSLLRIMENSKSPHVGMIWDICNMWSVKNEPPALVYEKLKKYIMHTHFADFKYIGNKFRSVLLGQGEAPIIEAIKALKNGNYDGYYGFEWEKLWEPDIEDPEIAFPQFITEIKKYLKT